MNCLLFDDFDCRVVKHNATIVASVLFCRLRFESWCYCLYGVGCVIVVKVEVGGAHNSHIVVVHIGFRCGGNQSFAALVAVASVASVFCNTKVAWHQNKSKSQQISKDKRCDWCVKGTVNNQHNGCANKGKWQ